MLSPVQAPASVQAPSPVEVPAPLQVASPVRAPSLLETDIEDSFEYNVSIEPFVVKFVGNFDLTDDSEMLIINVIDELISPYLMMEVGEILKYIDIEMRFMNEDNGIATSAYGGSRTLQSTAHLLEVSGSLDLEGASQDQVQAWDEQKVTAIVRDFFSVTHLDNKLLASLVEKDLNLNGIAIDDGNADSLVTDEGSSTQSTNNSSGGSSFADFIQNRTVLLVAGICGGVVCIILAVALVVKVRRIQWSEKFGKVRRVRKTMRKSRNAETLNLRSGHDDLPDCNASTSASSHVSFPDVFGDAPENVKSNGDSVAPDAASDSDISLDDLLGDESNHMDERWYSEQGASDSDISLGELLGDYDDIELNDIEDRASSYKGIRSSKRNKKRDKK